MTLPPFHKIYYLLPPVLALVLLAIFPHWTVDDAYISYTYGQNLYTTGQLTWHPSQPPIEGFTGYLLPLLATLFLSLKLPLETAFPILGALSTLGILALFTATLRRLQVSPWLCLIFTTLLALSPLLYIHAHSGLETNTFALVLLAWLYTFTAPPAPTHRNLLAQALLATLLVLIRPEGMVPIALTFYRAIYFTWHTKRWILLAPALLMALLVTAFQLLRYHHFQAWLPNTYWAKSYHGLLNLETLKDLTRFLTYYALIPLAIGGILWLIEADTIRQSTRAPQQAPLRISTRTFVAYGLLTTTLCLAMYFRANLYMNYAGRFFVPFLPFVLTLAAIATHHGLQHLQASRPHFPLRYRYLSTLIGIGILLQLLALGLKWKSETAWLQHYHAIMEQQLKPLAQDLKASLPPSAKVISYMDAGYLAYHTRLHVIDFGRLNDPYLPAHPQGSPQAIDYFFAQQAAAAVFTSHAPDRYLYTDEAHAIQSDPRFSQYILTKVYAAPGIDDYYQFVYHRKNAP